jgi:hypothetical protein
VLTPQERTALGEPPTSSASSNQSHTPPNNSSGGTGPSDHLQGGSPSKTVPAAGLRLGLGDFIEWVLHRDPNRRPTLAKVRERLQHMREQCLQLCTQGVSGGG